MKTIGIIGAMPSELVGISELLGSAEKIKKSGFEFTVCNYCDKKIVYACCGIAKVNAALCSQAMIFNFGVEAIINTGVAGGMNPDVKVCDIVISTIFGSYIIPLFFSISCLQTERGNASLYARFDAIASIESHIAIIRAPMGISSPFAPKGYPFPSHLS